MKTVESPLAELLDFVPASAIIEAIDSITELALIGATETDDVCPASHLLTLLNLKRALASCASKGKGTSPFLQVA